MKITKKVFKKMIREELAKNDNVKEEKEGVMPDYSDYEAEDLSSDEQMIVLLKEILAQLKVLNYTMTPAKTVGASAGEKARASYTVAESEGK